MMPGEAGEQRRVMEQALTYLKTWQDTAAQSPGGELAANASAIAPSAAASADLVTEANSQQLLQALLQEMQYLRVQMVQPLTSEVMALQQQRETLKNEVRQLELERLQRSPAGESGPPPAWVNEVVGQLRSSLLEQLAPQFRALQSQINDNPALYGHPTPELLEGAPDLPQLTPQQRLEQLRLVQAQTDSMLLRLDANLRAVFESLDQSIQSYCDTLNQGLDAMHGLGQQGEFLFRTFINHLAEQLQEESAELSTRLSTRRETARLPGQVADSSDEPDDALISRDELMEAVVNLDDVDLDDLDDVDLDVDLDEEVTLFQLDEEFSDLPLDELDETDDWAAIAAVEDAAEDAGEQTIIQTQPVSWEVMTGQVAAGTEDAAAIAEEPTVAYTEEIDALYASIFGDSETAIAEPESLSLTQDANEAVDQPLLSTDAPTVADHEPAETVAEAAATPATESPSLDLDFLLAADAPSTDDAADSAPPSLESLVGAEMAAELSPPTSAGVEGHDTITSLTELLPTSEQTHGTRHADPFAAFDESEDTFIPAPPDENLLDTETTIPHKQVELTLDDATLGQLSSDLSRLEGMTAATADAPASFLAEPDEALAAPTPFDESEESMDLLAAFSEEADAAPEIDAATLDWSDGAVSEADSAPSAGAEPAKAVIPAAELDFDEAASVDAPAEVMPSDGPDPFVETSLTDFDLGLEAMSAGVDEADEIAIDLDLGGDEPALAADSDLDADESDLMPDMGAFSAYVSDSPSDTVSEGAWAEAPTADSDLDLGGDDLFPEDEAIADSTPELGSPSERSQDSGDEIPQDLADLFGAAMTAEEDEGDLSIDLEFGQDFDRANTDESPLAPEPATPAADSNPSAIAEPTTTDATSLEPESEDIEVVRPPLSRADLIVDEAVANSAIADFFGDETSASSPPTDPLTETEDVALDTFFDGSILESAATDEPESEPILNESADLGESAPFSDSWSEADTDEPLTLEEAFGDEEIAPDEPEVSLSEADDFTLESAFGDEAIAAPDEPAISPSEADDFTLENAFGDEAIAPAEPEASEDEFSLDTTFGEEPEAFANPPESADHDEAPLTLEALEDWAESEPDPLAAQTEAPDLTSESLFDAASAGDEDDWSLTLEDISLELELPDWSSNRLNFAPETDVSDRLTDENLTALTLDTELFPDAESSAPPADAAGAESVTPDELVENLAPGDLPDDIPPVTDDLSLENWGASLDEAPTTQSPESLSFEDLDFDLSLDLASDMPASSATPEADDIAPEDLFSELADVELPTLDEVAASAPLIADREATIMADTERDANRPDSAFEPSAPVTDERDDNPTDAISTLGDLGDAFPINLPPDVPSPEDKNEFLAAFSLVETEDEGVRLTSEVPSTALFETLATLPDAEPAIAAPVPDRSPLASEQPAVDLPEAAAAPPSETPPPDWSIQGSADEGYRLQLDDTPVSETIDQALANTPDPLTASLPQPPEETAQLQRQLGQRLLPLTDMTAATALPFSTATNLTALPETDAPIAFAGTPSDRAIAADRALPEVPGLPIAGSVEAGFTIALSPTSQPVNWDTLELLPDSETDAILAASPDPTSARIAEQADPGETEADSEPTDALPGFWSPDLEDRMAADFTEATGRKTSSETPSSEAIAGPLTDDELADLFPPEESLTDAALLTEADAEDDFGLEAPASQPADVVSWETASAFGESAPAPSETDMPLSDETVSDFAELFPPSEPAIAPEPEPPAIDTVLDDTPADSQEVTLPTEAADELSFPGEPAAGDSFDWDPMEADFPSAESTSESPLDSDRDDDDFAAIPALDDLDLSMEEISESEIEMDEAFHSAFDDLSPDPDLLADEGESPAEVFLDEEPPSASEMAVEGRDRPAIAPPPSLETEEAPAEADADAAIFASSGVLATLGDHEPAAGQPDEDAAAEAGIEAEWYLGIDLGTTGLSAVLMEPDSGSAHPLCWVAASATEDQPANFRMPTVAAFQPPTANSASVGELVAVGQAAEAASEQLLHTLRPLLRVGIPYHSPDAGAEPVIQWADSQTVSQPQIMSAVQALLQLISHPDEAGPRLEAIGLDADALQTALDHLQGVVMGVPTNWSDTYCFNMREAVLTTGLVASPGQIFFVEEAIAAILSGLPDPSAPLLEPNRQVQTLYQCNWQGGTVVISGGASCTEVGIVDLPQPLDALSREDFKLRNLAYGGDALDLDIICQLLIPPERRQPLGPSDRRQSNQGWGWQSALPEVAHARWEDLQIEAIDLPQLAEPDPSARQRLRQHLRASPLGQSLLEAARYLKLILQNQNQYQLELADQSWRVLRRDLESRVLVPYIQRINQQVNALLSQTGLASQGINQVICTGGNASFNTIAKWLRQKFPNATIIQDTYPSNRPQTCSRVAYGLVNLCRYPQVLDVPRHQYSDYFLLYEMMRVMPDAPMPFDGILHVLEEQGINTEVCQSRIAAILEGHLPPGLLPDAATRELLSRATLMSPTYQNLAAGSLFSKQTRDIYMVNAAQRDRLRNHLTMLMQDKQQSLTEPMIAQLVAL